MAHLDFIETFVFFFALVDLRISFSSSALLLRLISFLFSPPAFHPNLRVVFLSVFSGLLLRDLLYLPMDCFTLCSNFFLRIFFPSLLLTVLCPPLLLAPPSLFAFSFPFLPYSSSPVCLSLPFSIVFFSPFSFSATLPYFLPHFAPRPTASSV